MALAPLQSLADPFSDGQAFGQGMIDSTFANINAAKADEVLPGRPASVPESGLVTSSPQGLFNPAVSKIGGCKTATSPDQECAAVNFLAKNPNERVQFTIDKTTDPTLAKSREMLSTDSLSAMAALGNTAGACTEVQTSTPDETRIEVCNAYHAFGVSTCQKTLNVTTVGITRFDLLASTSCTPTVCRWVAIECGCDRPYDEFCATAISESGYCSRCKAGVCTTQTTPCVTMGWSATFPVSAECFATGDDGSNSGSGSSSQCPSGFIQSGNTCTEDKVAPCATYKDFPATISGAGSATTRMYICPVWQNGCGLLEARAQ
jgi:hypothetical protein